MLLLDDLRIELGVVLKCFCLLLDCFGRACWCWMMVLGGMVLSWGLSALFVVLIWFCCVLLLFCLFCFYLVDVRWLLAFVWFMDSLCYSY